MMTDFRERALSLTSLTRRDYSQNLQLELSKLENIRYFSKSNIEKFSQSYKLLMNVLKDKQIRVNKPPIPQKYLNEKLMDIEKRKVQITKMEVTILLRHSVKPAN
jgi:hypothetical protein